MRLLIAEDEEYTREGLIESIQWNDLGIDEIMQASDGIEALKISQWFKPDIVLTDIKMPKLSGIEFAEKLLKICPDTKLLFMSGYLDIGYLKSAIQLSAVDYIEKPINTTMVVNAIKKAIEYIVLRKKQNLVNVKKKELEMQKLATMMRYKNSDKAFLYNICEEIGFPTDSNYIAAAIWDKDNLYSEEENINRINNYFRENGLFTICSFIEDKVYLAIIELKQKDEHKVQRVCQKLVDKDKSLSIGLGFLVDSIMSVAESYKVAMFNLNRSFYNVEKSLFTMDDKILNIKNIDPYIYSEYNSIMRNSPKKLLQWMEEFFQKLCEMECYKKEHVKNMFFNFARVILQEKKSIITKLEGIYSEDDVEQFIMGATSTFQIKDFILKLVENYQKEVEEGYKYSKVVRDVLDYIDSHYTDADLGIEDIAEYVHLSYAHLSVLFKQETGVTLKQYIGDYRLELSKKLLANKHYKVNEIAELCGYSNANYFAKVFKAATDQSPIEYRSKCGIE